MPTQTIRHVERNGRWAEATYSINDGVATVHASGTGDIERFLFKNASRFASEGATRVEVSIAPTRNLASRLRAFFAQQDGA